MGDALVGWLLGLGLSAITVSIVVAVTGTEAEDLSLGWLAAAQTGLWVGLLTVPLVVGRTKGDGTVAEFGVRARPVDALVGGVAGFLTQVVVVPIVYVPIMLVRDVDVDDIGEPARDMTDRADSGFGILMLVLIVGVAAPVIEEIFYRGLVQRAMERRFGPVPGLLLASLVFGIIHFQALQLPALAVAGLIFGLLAQRAGRLGPAMAAHVVFNMVAVVSLVWLS